MNNTDIITKLRIAMTDARQNESHFESWMILNEAICDAIDALAEQPAQQEPVGALSVRYHRGCKSMTNTDFDYNGDLPEGDYELYTSPQPAQRKPLTETEIRTIRCDMAGTLDVQYVAFARAIEAAHGIKGEV